MENKEGTVPAEVPVLPTRGAVIYPFLVVPLFVGRPRSIKALEAAMKEDRRIALLAQRNVNVDDPGAEDLYQVGTIGEIVQTLPLPDGTVRVMIEGSGRITVGEYEQTEPFLSAHIDLLPEVEQPGVETEALVRNVIGQFERLINLGKNIPAEALESARRMSDPGRLADLIAYYAQIAVEVKQQILEAADQRKRLEILAGVLNREIEILEVERKISSRVKQELEESQKEYYLREKMKAIQQELGERDERTGEIEELRERVKEAKMPEDVEERALKEIDRLERMPPASPEVVVVRTYLDWLIAMPWQKRSDEKLDIVQAERILNEDHYGLKKVKERVLEFLAVRKLNPDIKGPILCFIGPPGVGKTSIGKSIARATGREFVRISLGGVRDEGEIRGHRRTYVGALPGRIVQGLKTAGTRNPVFMMDEVDKIGVDFRGDPASALLEVLDPEQNDSFSDHYLEVPLDLSEVMFITTGNLRDPIPPALKDRMEVIEFPGYIEDEKLKIAQLFLVPKQLKNHGLTQKQLRFTEAGLRAVVREYTREAGVRNLEREVASISRKVAKGIAQEKIKSARLTGKSVRNYLGPPRFRFGVAEKEDEIGVVTGLGWTEFGGDILSIEATLMKGKGSLQLTGHLGDVMQESGRAALSYARARAEDLGIDPDFYRVTDVHVHVPQGQIPKDGPSAGITMGAALISALTGRPAYRNVAMTGEITLRGKVLPVGGIKEKVLAAHRAGIKTIILPEENKKDLEEIPKNVQEDLKFRFVSEMGEVIKYALHQRPKRTVVFDTQPRERDITPAQLSQPGGAVH
ncbi:MAG: endopeptidase La [Armatimonadetes bacterium]|nr:endopeptidase La [Armatimonadota bacterium]